MATLATDNFDRADGGLGANWTTVTSQNNPQIVGNLVQPVAVNAPNSVAFYNAVTWPDAQYAQVVAITINTNTSRAVAAICRASSTAQTYYTARARGPFGAGATWQISKKVTGTTTVLASGTTTINTNDTVSLQVSGSNLVLTVNTVQIGSATDSAISAGNAGLEIFTDAGAVTGAQLDNWEGGNLQVLQSPSSPWPQRGQFAPLLAQ